MLLTSQALVRHFVIAGVTSSLLPFSGCATQPRLATAAPEPERPSVVGEIALVNEEKRFVLIDLGSNLYVPAPGVALRSISRAGPTTHLKASLEQKRPFIAADIVDGEPAVGGEVVR